MADVKNLNVAGNVLVSNDVVISGNLDVLGTTTTITSSTVAITDKDLVLAKDNTTDASADGAGIIIKAGTDKTFLYDYNGGTDRFASSIALDVSGAITGATVTTTGTITAGGGFSGDGSAITNITASGINAPGNNTEIVYNNNGPFGSDSNLTFDANTGTLATSILSLSTPLAIASGGTGANTAAGVRTNIALSSTDNVTFADITATGVTNLQNGLNVTSGNTILTNDFTVNGITNLSGTVNISDDIIDLGVGSATATAQGIKIEQGTGTRTGYFTWSKNNSRWSSYYSDNSGAPPFVEAPITASEFIGNVTGDVTGTVSDISNHDTDALSEGSTNLYYTDERVDDRINALVQAGTNISVVYDDAANTFTINAVSGSGYDLSNNTTTDLAEGTNLYYTDARARTAISLNSSNLNELSYDNTTGVLTYVSPSTVAATGQVIINVRNASGVDISRGDAVYLAGHNGNKILVAKADANSSGEHPSIGLANNAMLNNSDGTVLIQGEMDSLDTSTFAVNDVLYLSETAGELTATRPSASGTAVQNMGKVARRDNQNGIIVVTGAGRSNDVPNLSSGHVFIGNGSGYDKRSLTTNDVSEGTNLYYTDVRARAVSIENVSEDSSPSLGGNLDLNNNNINGTGNIDITGIVKLGSITSTTGTGGEIRWTGSDFVGYDGSAWQSLTATTINQNTSQIANFTSAQNTTSTSFGDVPGYTTNITTTQANSKLRVSLNITRSGDEGAIKLVRTIGATNTDLIEVPFLTGDGNLTTTYVDSPNVTSGTVVTYKIQHKIQSSGTAYVNFTGTNNQISIEEVAVSPVAVTSVNGSAGNVVLDLEDMDNVDNTGEVDGSALIKSGTEYVASSNNTGAMIMPVGTTAQRPGSPVQGMIRFNSDTNKFEGYDGTDWINLVSEIWGDLT